MIPSAGNRMGQIVVLFFAGWLMLAGVLLLPVCQNTVAAAPCDYDQNSDGDTDGLDLSALTENNSSLYLAEFAADFGRTDCEAACRELLPCSMDAADTCFAESAAAKNDPVDRTFHAVTRILSLISDPEINTMLTRLGVAETVRTFCGWSAWWEKDADGGPLLPDVLPASGVVLDLVVDKLLPEIEGALNELPAMDEISADDPQGDPLMVLCEELRHPEDAGPCENIEVDYGDIALYRALLYFIKGFLIVIDTYDLNIEQTAEFIAALRSNQFVINDYLCTNGPACFSQTLLSPGPGAFMKLPLAKAAFRKAIDSYMAASEFIRAETDDQSDDLIAMPVDPEEITEEEEFRAVLSEIRQSLSKATLIGGASQNVDDPFEMDLQWFFDHPFDLRDNLPEFTDENDPVCGSFDSTLGGILPGFDHDDWANGLRLRVPVTGAVTCAAGLACGQIHVGAFSPDRGTGFGGSLIAGDILSSPGAYSLPVWAEEEAVQVAAFWDRNSDGMLSPGDYTGSYPVPIAVNALNCAGPENIDITISEALIGISGQVTCDGQPVPDIRVRLHADRCGSASATAVTDENGYYVLAGDATENVFLSIDSDRHISGRWDGTAVTADCSQAAGYLPSSGQTVVNMTIEKADSISGTVRDAAGNPLQYAYVTAWNYDGGLGSWLNGVSADENGVYTLYLKQEYSGFVIARAEQNMGNYINEYYDNQIESFNATPIRVLDPVSGEPHVSGIDFYLDAGGKICGFVQDRSGTPIANARVYALAYETGIWISDAVTQIDGYYEIQGLVTGNYRVHVSLIGYADAYFNHADSVEDADPVSVTAPQTTSGISFTLGRDGEISGTVVRAVDQVPLEGIWIHLYDAGTGDYQYSIETDAAGDYAFTGLSPGNYMVEAHEYGPGGYLTAYYSSTDDFETAAVVSLVPGQNAGNINFFLETGSTITGHVYASGGQPLYLVRVRAYNAATGAYAGACDTDMGGGYMIGGLRSGSYQLEVLDYQYYMYLGEWYPDALDMTSAIPVNVGIDETVKGIDFYLETE